MENKKISFGFSKISRKTEVLPKTNKEQPKLDLIECLEGQSIKIKDAVEEVKGPLVIPIKNSANKLLDRIKEAKEQHLKLEEEKPDSELTIDELAARELIREAKNRGIVKSENKVFTLPLSEEKFVAEGEAEPTLHDYENVPISDYGMAMLRGMGWKEGMPIGKNASKTIQPVLPELRPKGLGLGANKMVTTSKPAQDKDGKDLLLVKGAFVKIIAGSHRGHYCQVESLDDENCRVIVKTALTNNVLSLNEFLVVPVTRQEYAVGSKVINNAKYEEYKETEDKKLNERRNGRSASSDSDRECRKRSKKTKKSRHRSRSRESRHKRHGKKSKSRRRGKDT